MKLSIVFLISVISALFSSCAGTVFYEKNSKIARHEVRVIENYENKLPMLVSKKSGDTIVSRVVQNAHGLIGRYCSGNVGVVRNNKNKTFLLGAYHCLTFSGECAVPSLWRKLGEDIAYTELDTNSMIVKTYPNRKLESCKFKDGTFVEVVGTNYIEGMHVEQKITGKAYRFEKDKHQAYMVVLGDVRKFMPGQSGSLVVNKKGNVIGVFVSVKLITKNDVRYTLIIFELLP